MRNLVEDRTVWLEADGVDLDRWGRLRRYVWVEKPADKADERQIRNKMLNALLLEGGHARAMIVGSPRHGSLFMELCGKAE